MRSTSRLPALAAALALALALGSTVGQPARPDVSTAPEAEASALSKPGTASPATAGTVPEALPSLTCSNCVSLCLLQRCGFSEPPACVNANLAGCQAHCASSCG
jgi:hypothetical protein